MLASVLALVACLSATELPTHDLLEGGHSVPAGLITGTLVDRADCVYVQVEDGTSLVVVWPRGFVRIGQQIASGGNPVVQVGEEATIFGGSIEAARYEAVRPTIGGSAIPEFCSADLYWLATDVEVLPPE